MADIWGFLLQTLTASGAAVLLLAVKAMFRDKLPPRWQFAAWGVLGLVLLLPAGAGGRYVLVNWPWLVETARTVLTGDYSSLARITAPIPLPRFQMPGTAAEWLYAAYVLGAALLLARYAVTYVRLRRLLRRGRPAGEVRAAQIRSVAERYGLPDCPAAEVPGLTTAFICGVLRPVLALPAGREVDDKVILHELLHLKHQDAAWGLAVCFFRCVHWCNPLLWYCADRAGNDLEARCDQRVLELLEGEDRRDYGRILLSMAEERYARAPGTSSMANGGRNIRRRVEAIARFKKYPAGMALVSVCVAATLAAPLTLGARAGSVYDGDGYGALGLPAAMASARTTFCTTYAGALDAYAKAVLDQNGIYRAMCAPLEGQAEIADSMTEAGRRNEQPAWDSGLPSWPRSQSGYVVYNLEPVGEDAYEGLLAVELNYPPDGQAAKDGYSYLGVQRVRAENRAGRWVALPLEDFQAVEIAEANWGQLWGWGCEELPAYRYQAAAADFLVEMRYQTMFYLDNTIQETGGAGWMFGPSTRFDTVPKPHGTFSGVHRYWEPTCTYVGGPAKKDGITQLGLSTARMDALGERPELRSSGGITGGGSSTGECWGGRSLEKGWGPAVSLGGSEGSDAFDPDTGFELPAGFAADLYLNGEKAAELTLLPVEGGAR